MKAAIPAAVGSRRASTEFEAITLERGVTHDTEFEKWANKVWNFGSGLGAEVSLKDFRKDIIIELYNEAGQLALAYKVFRCWVSEFQAFPTSMRMRMQSQSNTSNWRTRVGSETMKWRNPLNPPSLNRRCNETMRPLSAAELLDVWERGFAQAPVERALTLLKAACPELSLRITRKADIGDRDLRLLTLREWTFGSQLLCLATCTGCGEQLELSLRAADLFAPETTDLADDF